LDDAAIASTGGARIDSCRLWLRGEKGDPDRCTSAGTDGNTNQFSFDAICSAP
jgi:hypothetical protein